MYNTRAYPTGFPRRNSALSTSNPMPLSKRRKMDQINIHVAMHMIERSSLETYNEVKASVSRNQIRENMKHMHRRIAERVLVSTSWMMYNVHHGLPYTLRDTIIRRTGIFFQPVYNNRSINQPLDHSARAVVQTQLISDSLHCAPLNSDQIGLHDLHARTIYCARHRLAAHHRGGYW